MEEFEKWALSKELGIEHNPHPEKGFAYYDIETQMFWECWQASAQQCVHPTRGTCACGNEISPDNQCESCAGLL